MNKKIILASNTKDKNFKKLKRDLEKQGYASSEILKPLDAIENMDKKIDLLILNIDFEALSSKDLFNLIDLAQDKKVNTMIRSDLKNNYVNKLIKVSLSINKEINNEEIIKKIDKVLNVKRDSKKPKKRKNSNAKRKLNLKGVVLIFLPNTSKITDKSIEIIYNENPEKIIYISLEKSREFILEKFPDNKNLKERVFIIDCISAFYKPVENKKDCYYVSAPYKLDEIGNILKKKIDKNSIILFDSLSALTSYSYAIPAGTNKVGLFIDSFSDKLNEKKSSILFLSLKEDENSLLITESKDRYNQIIQMK